MFTQTQTIIDSQSAQASGSLSSIQKIGGTLFGILFWFAGAMTAQFGAAAGLFEQGTTALMFALGVPLIWASVVIIGKTLRLHRGQHVPVIAIGGVAATLCDGIALTWVRGLYGTDPAQIVRGAAWILWGVGLFLLFAFSADRRRA